MGGLTFNKVSAQEVKRLLVLTVINVCVLTMLYVTKYIIFLLLSWFLLCFLITGLILSLTKNWAKDAGFIVSLLLALLSLLPAMLLEPHLLERLNHSFYDENTVDFKQYTETMQNTPHKFIFCFDNSGGYIDREYNKNTYSYLLKKQLCSDLEFTLKNNKKGIDDIMFIKLYDPGHDLSYDWKSLNQENINDILKNLEQHANPDISDRNTVSDFFSLYDKIKEKRIDNTTTLFIYSDFIHDLTPKITEPSLSNAQKLDEDVNKIVKIQQDLLDRQVTCIAFFVPVDKCKKDERNVLPYSNDRDSLFLKCFNITKSNKLIPNKIRRISNLHFLYYNDQDWINARLRLKFEKIGNHIIDVDKQFIISDGDEKYHFKSDRGLKNEEVFVKYSKETEPEKLPRLTIIQDGIHYHTTCNFKSNGDKKNIYLFMAWCCLLGIMAGCCIIKKQKNKVII